MRIDRVLRHQRAVEAQGFGFQDQAAVALPGGVVWLVRVLQRGAAAVDQSPDAEPDGGRGHRGVFGIVGWRHDDAKRCDVLPGEAARRP